MMSGTVLGCAVWDILAEQLHDHATHHSNDGVIVVIIHFGRLHEYKGQAQVTNCFYGTKLILDVDLLEVSSFCADFLLRKKEGAAHRVSEFVDRSKYLLFADFVKKFPRKKLCELRDITKEGKYIVGGTITALKLDPTWYYLSFNKCLGGVVEDDGEEFEVHITFNSKTVGKWKCNNCKPKGIDAVRRYWIQIHVQDS